MIHFLPSIEVILADGANTHIIAVIAGDYWTVARALVFLGFNASIFGLEHSVTLADILIDVPVRQQR